MIRHTVYDSSFGRRLGFVGERSKQYWHQLRVLRRFTRVKLDLTLMSAALAAFILQEPSFRNISSIGQLLKFNITLGDGLRIAVCLALWRLAIRATHRHISTRSALSDLFWQSVATVTASTGVVGVVVGSSHPHFVQILGHFWIASVLAILISRFAIAAVKHYRRTLVKAERRVIIVGTGEKAKTLLALLPLHPRWDYRVLGVVDSDPQCETGLLLGGIDDLDAILMRRVVDQVIIALPMRTKYDDAQEAVRACERAGIQSEYSTDLFETEIAKRRSVGDLSDSVTLHMVHNERHRGLKRAFDVLAAMSLLVVLSPLLLVVAFVVACTSRGPIIFKQDRYGLNKRTFKMYKFRSMVADAESRLKDLEHLNETDGPAFKMKRDPRITTVGRIIRKTSIDELPQLLNVIYGQMSLVGPRPLPMRDVNGFAEATLMRRFSVKPGLTGLWQVSGRSNTTFSEWIKLDLEYIDTWSFTRDLEILMRTLPAVIRKDGAA